ncbi:response regulator transcription factor [Odoribacter lunatus]|uniref:response regulator transcription factor n=1 Tax=Odoribacter lunatus TaxID=2941335 RepID=UPI00203AF467|nr:response regulator transcription factor [Odoribacter lunatus]
MEQPIKILYAEDEVMIAELNRDMLTRAGYAVDIASNGKEAWEKYKTFSYDILLLDIMMPGMSGFQLLQAIREVDTAIPIVIYTSISGSGSVAKALDMGADEYIRKECEPPEIIARLNVIARHIGKDLHHILSEITSFSYADYSLTLNGKKIKLTPSEAKLLRFLCEKQNTVVSKSFLCEKLWGIATFGKERTIDNYMVKLRKYLKPDKSLQIVTGYGEGFTLVTEANK